MASSAEDSSLSTGSRSDPAALEEAYGPLRVRRHVKDDGRALILYSRRTSRGISDDPETSEDPKT